MEALGRHVEGIPPTLQGGLEARRRMKEAPVGSPESFRSGRAQGLRRKRGAHTSWLLHVSLSREVLEMLGSVLGRFRSAQASGWPAARAPATVYPDAQRPGTVLTG